MKLFCATITITIYLESHFLNSPLSKFFSPNCKNYKNSLKTIIL